MAMASAIASTWSANMSANGPSGSAMSSGAGIIRGHAGKRCHGLMTYGHLQTHSAQNRLGCAKGVILNIRYHSLYGSTIIEGTFLLIL